MITTYLIIVIIILKPLGTARQASRIINMHSKDRKSRIEMRILGAIERRRVGLLCVQIVGYVSVRGYHSAQMKWH